MSTTRTLQQANSDRIDESFFQQFSLDDRQLRAKAEKVFCSEALDFINEIRTLNESKQGEDIQERIRGIVDEYLSSTGAHQVNMKEDLDEQNYVNNIVRLSQQKKPLALTDFKKIMVSVYEMMTSSLKDTVKEDQKVTVGRDERSRSVSQADSQSQTEFEEDKTDNSDKTLTKAKGLFGALGKVFGKKSDQKKESLLKIQSILPETPDLLTKEKVDQCLSEYENLYSSKESSALGSSRMQLVKTAKTMLANGDYEHPKDVLAWLLAANIDAVRTDGKTAKAKKFFHMELTNLDYGVFHNAVLGKWSTLLAIDVENKLKQYANSATTADNFMQKVKILSLSSAASEDKAKSVAMKRLGGGNE